MKFELVLKRERKRSTLKPIFVIQNSKISISCRDAGKLYLRIYISRLEEGLNFRLHFFFYEITIIQNIVYRFIRFSSLLYTNFKIC